MRWFEPLRTSAEFSRVFDQGERHSLGPFAVQAALGNQGFRVGFKIGKRLGHAPIRNRIRRRLRAALERFSPPESSQGLELVFLPRRRVARMPFLDLERKLAQVLVPFGFALRSTPCPDPEP